MVEYGRKSFEGFSSNFSTQGVGNTISSDKTILVSKAKLNDDFTQPSVVREAHKVLDSSPTYVFCSNGSVGDLDGTIALRMN